ncbi:MAG: hypothetical protein CHACPFDD_01409 [Phycisphaerae bacterium]|nr:hypothetical protein [Phycisphaerae bacterium]
MKRIFSAVNPLDAEQCTAALQAAGVRAVTVGEVLTSAVGGLPALTPMIEVWVPDEAWEQAREIVEQLPPMSTGRKCPHCGYDLRGLPASRCPECGEPFGWTPPPAESKSWVCAMCGETVEEQFTACWNCGSERPAPP